MTNDVTDARKMWAFAAATMERDVRLHEMTDDEIAAMIGAIINGHERDAARPPSPASQPSDVELRGPYPDKSPFGEVGVRGSPLAYLIDPGSGSGSDRVSRFWPDRATLDDIHRRGGSITPLATQPPQSNDEVQP